MSVTVKVLCQLAVFLVAFLDQTVAKYSQDAEFNGQQEPGTRSISSDISFSEFTDDIASLKEEPGPGKYYEKEKYEKRYKRQSEEVEFRKDKNKYEKEQYWNQDEFEVEEEPTDITNQSTDESNVDEEVPKVIKVRRVRQSTPEVRYPNHRYDEPDSEYEESRQAPAVRKNIPYEVYEISEEEESASSERLEHTRLPPPPQRVVYKGVHYVRAPEPAPSKTYYVRRDGPSSEHYHLAGDSAGSPPVSRYTQTHDLAGAESGKKRSQHHASGGGNDHHARRHSAQGLKEDKGYKSAHHNEKGAKGKEGREKHAKQYDEHGGKKHKEHDAAAHYGEHQEAAQGQKGADFDEKKAHKKGHNTKGYHNKYHKDEYHKEHKFYDDYHKSGSHSRYGDFNAKHSSNEGGHKKKEYHDSSKHEDNAGKKGQYAKGHVDEDHKGHENKKGYEKHHAHHSDYGKKGGHQGGSSYGYQTKH